VAAAASAVLEADAELAAARSARQQAMDEVEGVRHQLEAARQAAARLEEGERLRAELEAAEAVLEQAMAADSVAERDVEGAAAALARAESELAQLEGGRAVARAADLPLRDDAGTDQDDEIYVLSRLANARSVGRFGAVPVLLVEPFSRFGPARGAAVRELLGRMAAAVQIIYMTEDPDVVTWGRQLGQQRARVLRFGATADAAI
jgi:uncharacterized protein YhaN